LNRNLSVIIAEDDPVNQEITLRMLRKLGIKAKAAANGLELLQVLERQPCDMILMDIQMPEMDGIQAARIIRERWSHGPSIIFVTDCDSGSYRELCFDAGANEFLAKPVKMEKLTAAIENSQTMAMPPPMACVHDAGSI
jgi:CheY-like chemotaxis protein